MISLSDYPATLPGARRAAIADKAAMFASEADASGAATVSWTIYTKAKAPHKATKAARRLADLSGVDVVLGPGRWPMRPNSEGEYAVCGTSTLPPGDTGETLAAALSLAGKLALSWTIHVGEDGAALPLVLSAAEGRNGLKMHSIRLVELRISAPETGQ